MEYVETYEDAIDIANRCSEAVPNVKFYVTYVYDAGFYIQPYECKYNLCYYLNGKQFFEED